MNKNTNYSKEDKIRLRKMIKDLDNQIKRLEFRREYYKEQLTLTDVVSTCCDDKEISLKNKIRLADIDRYAK